MKFEDYIGTSPGMFQEAYIDTGLVNVAHHKDFPLSIYSYGRKAVHENIWDHVTSRCRGIIVNRDTGDIVSRPFEKFHNYGSEQAAMESRPILSTSEPVVWEKMDGFMCTAYTWEGKNYIASKGSFHSVHAKWATAELHRKMTESGYVDGGGELVAGHTLMFEGLNKDLRIVVDYGENELVLLACINNKTGEEKDPRYLRTLAGYLNMRTPEVCRMTVEDARQETLKAYSNEEGYVLTWYRTGETPFRLKMKFVEYLRLHRIVTGVSPRRIWEALANKDFVGMDEYLNNSTEWFAKFAKKWQKALEAEYVRLSDKAHESYLLAKADVRADDVIYGFTNMGEERKRWAREFNKPENAEVRAILFNLLDDKDPDLLIWKQVRRVTSGGNPMVDAHNT
jgi:RNA ligase